MPFSSDTIKIDEVTISHRTTGNGQAGFKTKTIDSSVIKLCSQESLAELLSRHSSIFIKSYGMGGTASPSFRGTGAGHTQLAWNEINLNSPMLGQSDFALIPAGLIDGVQIYCGGASMQVGSGGLGGIVNISTGPIWRKETMISLSPGIGSFGQYGTLLKVRTGSEGFQSVTRVFYQYAANDFPYINDVSGAEPVKEKRHNSQISQRGLLQELYYRKGEDVLSARIWYQAADRNLPSTMLVQQPGLKETQFDEALRSLLNYNHSLNLGKLVLTGAWIQNRLDYNNSLVSIKSRNNSNTLFFKSGIEKPAGENFKLKMSLDEQVNFINSNNYEDKKARNTLNLTVSAENSIVERLGGTILLRETLDRNDLLIPDFSAGLQYRVISCKEYFLKANISRNSKIPSMNDLYWLPGGNPDLRNEYAFTYELSAEMTKKISLPLELKANMTLFRNSIRDMIQWLPGEYSYWTAGNVKSVHTYGLESSAELNYSVEKFTSGFSANYSYTKASAVSSNTVNDASIGKQLIYVPVNLFNSTFTAGYGKLYSSWVFAFTGKRYITSDNSDCLPSYGLNNLIAGFRTAYKTCRVDLKLQADNIFNVNYQAIAYYPMPGRAYYVKLEIQFLK